MFQNLVFRCKDAKRQRREAIINNKYCCNFTKIVINENSLPSCHPAFCSSDFTHPFTSPPLKGGEKESSPQPSPIGECATRFVIADSAADPQSQDNEMLKHGGQSDIQDDTNPLPQSLPRGREVKRHYSRFTLHPSLRRKPAFTLAEVLITLGIIGVVAAMTIPGMIVKHQKQVFVTRMKQTYSIVSNAMMSSVAEYGEPNNWGVFGSFDATDPNYAQNQSDNMKMLATKYFKPYLKVIDEEGQTFQYTLFLSNGVSLTFYPDGSFNEDKSEFITTRAYIIASLNHNEKTFLDSSRDYSRKDFLMEINTATTGYKITGFNVKADKTRDDYTDDGQYGCNSGVEKHRRLYCGALLIHDGWQLKDDYPW